MCLVRPVLSWKQQAWQQPCRSKCSDATLHSPRWQQRTQIDAGATKGTNAHCALKSLLVLTAYQHCSLPVQEPAWGYYQHAFGLPCLNTDKLKTYVWCLSKKAFKNIWNLIKITECIKQRHFPNKISTRDDFTIWFHSGYFRQNHQGTRNTSKASMWLRINTSWAFKRFNCIVKRTVFGFVLTSYLSNTRKTWNMFNEWAISKCTINYKSR